MVDGLRTNVPSPEHLPLGLQYNSTADVWLAGVVVASGIPVVSGRVVTQVDQDVPERATISLPRDHEGLVLDPALPNAVLGSSGHRIVITTRVRTQDGQMNWEFPMGTFLVTRANRDGAQINVEGSGLLQLVADHLLARPGGVGKASPIRGEIMKMLALDGLEAYFSPELTERSVPGGFVWGEERLATLQELVTAWPARMRGTYDGRIGFYAPLSEDLVPDLYWRDGEGGTVVSAPLETTREGLFNHAIVPYKPTNGQAERVEEHFARTGPLAVSRFGWVSRRIESDAITTSAQARLIAINEVAAASTRSVVIPVETVPDWRAEVDDVVEVVTQDGLREWGRIVGIDMPLAPGDGTARYDVGVTI